jgi:hypothetical protein
MLVAGCNTKPPIPKNVLPPEKMQSVLWDLLRADELANYYIPSDSSFKTLDKHDSLYQDIFSIHKISKEDFKRSMKYYQSRPDLLQTIMDSLQHTADSSSRIPPKAQ